MLTFENAKTVSDLQQLMIEFLNGKWDETPWYVGNINRHTEDDNIVSLCTSIPNTDTDYPDTTLMLPALREINRLGFITTNSQGGLYEKYFIKDTDETRETKQRSHVVGMLRNELVKPLVNTLIASGKYVALVYDPKTEKKIFLGLENLCAQDRKNITDKKLLTLTCDRLVGRRKWECDTNLNLEVDAGSEHDGYIVRKTNPILYHELMHNTMNVDIVEIEWLENNIMRDIYRVLSKQEH